MKSYKGASGSRCNRRTVIKEKYCPACGAKMDLEE